MNRETMKSKFYEVLSLKPHLKNGFNMSRQKYNDLIQEVKVAKSGINRVNRHYWLLRHYDVLTANGKEFLITPNINNRYLYYISSEDLFNILYETHVTLGHKGRDYMRKELEKRFKNITISDIQLFLSLCETCVAKNEKRSITKPITPLGLNGKCRMNLIDYQSQSEGPHKYIMVYQELSTKFVILRPLKSEQIEEVSEQLLSIFYLFGPACVIESDKESEYFSSIVERLRLFWPELAIVFEEIQDQGNSIERDVENMLTKWMKENNNNSWVCGLGFVQYAKNQTFNADIKKPPYEAMFGRRTNTGSVCESSNREINIESVFETDLQSIEAKDNTIFLNKNLFMETGILGKENVSYGDSSKRKDSDKNKSDLTKHDFFEDSEVKVPFDVLLGIQDEKYEADANVGKKRKNVDSSEVGTEMKRDKALDEEELSGFQSLPEERPDEIALYMQLLESKLRSFDKRTRTIIVNKIDNTIFEAEMSNIDK